MIKMGIKDNGKQDLIFASTIRANLGLSTDELRARYGERLVPVPCGHCLGCRLDHAKSWAVRCILESLDHDENCFITLTYDEDHVSEKCIKEHLSAFIKRLRARHPGVLIKYFGCGERGSINFRPHYHCIIFGYDFKDREFLMKDEVSAVYRSKELESLWTFGMSSVGDVTMESCGYVARYTQKKVNSNFEDEFLLMSRRPGIGFTYFEKNKDRIYLSDHVYGSFGRSHKSRVPVYFDKLAEKDEDLFEILVTTKEKRVKRAAEYEILNRYYRKVEFIEQLNKLNEELLISRIKSLRRYL